MFRSTVRAAAAAMMFSSFFGCAGESSQPASESDITSGITSTKVLVAPKNVAELLLLLQSDAKGALKVNADVGAWEYVAGAGAAPFRAESTVYFTEKSPSSARAPYEKVLDVEGACGSSACQRHVYTAYTSLEPGGGFGVLIDTKEYRFAGLKPETFGPGPVAQTLVFEDTHGKIAFSLIRYRQGT